METWGILRMDMGFDTGIIVGTPYRDYFTGSISL